MNKRANWLQNIMIKSAVTPDTSYVVSGIVVIAHLLTSLGGKPQMNSTCIALLYALFCSWAAVDGPKYVYSKKYIK